jgi:hypothetical protein
MANEAVTDQGACLRELEKEIDGRRLDPSSESDAEIIVRMNEGSRDWRVEQRGVIYSLGCEICQAACEVVTLEDGRQKVLISTTNSMCPRNP